MGRTSASSHWPWFGTLFVSLEARLPEMRDGPAAPASTEEAEGWGMRIAGADGGV